MISFSLMMSMYCRQGCAFLHQEALSQKGVRLYLSMPVYHTVLVKTLICKFQWIKMFVYRSDWWVIAVQTLCNDLRYTHVRQCRRYSQI